MSSSLEGLNANVTGLADYVVRKSGSQFQTFNTSTSELASELANLYKFILNLY